MPRSLCLSPYKTLIDNNIDNLDKLLNDIAKEYINVSELTMYGDTKFNKSIDIITKVHSEKRNEILNGTSDLTKAEVQLFVAEVEKRVEQRLQEIKKN